MSWITPRIWRSAESKFNGDEPLDCIDVYTPKVLAGIVGQGFDAIWMRGLLWNLIRSKIYPELNDAKAGRRISNLQKVIADGKRQGVRLFLFFNEPMALPRKHEFWKRHHELIGEPYCEPAFDIDVLSFCTSTPQFKEFFDESIGNLYDDLAGLGGVIHITASDNKTHCWSHRARRSIGDPFLDKCLVDVECPYCKDREPADVVGELIGMWQTQAGKRNPAPKVWAWNWSWNIWYEPPQNEVIEKLPEGVELMCDFERGGFRRQDIGKVSIDEYSLGYTGPSEQFVGAMQAASARNMSTCAKLQIGTTHEIATVPNIPLIPNLFEKLTKADELGVKGLMCSWNFGNTATLNTAALKLFVDRAELRRDKDKFLHTLASEYFGGVDCHKIIPAWELFCRGFAEYPFCNRAVCYSPINYAVAYPLRLKYEDRPMGPSWIMHSPWGDRLEDCLGPFTIQQVCRCYGLIEDLWNQGLDLYAGALGDDGNRHQFEELSCARMIGCHLSAMRNIFEFHKYRRSRMRQLRLQGPCVLPADEKAIKFIRRQAEICKCALEFARNDSRFGFHQEPHAFFYDAKTIEAAAAECLKSQANWQ